MCGAPKVNNQAVVDQQNAEAEQARLREEQRKQRLETGQQKIRDAFAGYDDTYYGRFRDSFIAANKPTLDDQQEQDKRGLFYNLARAGLSNSSTGNDQRERLARALTLQQGKLVSAAEDATQRQRQQVADTQMNLENQLRATEDANLAGNNATAQARAIDRTPALTTGDWLTPQVTAGAYTGQNFAAGQSKGFYRALGEQWFPNSGGGSRGTARVVP